MSLSPGRNTYQVGRSVLPNSWMIITLQRFGQQSLRFYWNARVPPSPSLCLVRISFVFFYPPISLSFFSTVIYEFNGNSHFFFSASSAPMKYPFSFIPPYHLRFFCCFFRAFALRVINNFNFPPLFPVGPLGLFRTCVLRYPSLRIFASSGGPTRSPPSPSHFFFSRPNITP